ncbi:MAG: hypothetical protein JW891_15870 [Candidatus Lokiarchaeota archaeon]|nr:hypothetical protein [Candidatus Lokiarchaeota archaeon]
MIHSILILKKTGENIFSKTFGENAWNETLTSGFISAAFSFTQMSFKADIEEIELGPIRLFFEIGENFIVTAFFDKADSIINVRQRLRKIRDYITTFYKDVIDKEICCSEDFIGLGEIIEKIVLKWEEASVTEEEIEKVREILENLGRNPEVLACDIISISSGLPLIHRWNKEYLDLCLRQIDAFWKSKNYVLDQIILSYEQRHLILFKVSDNYVLSMLIRKDTPLGLATLLLEDAAYNIKKLY